MELSLFDLHCDTPYLMLRNAQPLFSNDLAISLENAKKFNRYVQVMALWTDQEYSDEVGWEQMYRMLDNLKKDPSVQSGEARLCDTAKELSRTRASLLLGIEDARILGGRLERVAELRALGVHIMTPLWRGVTCIGGSHDTDEGLTAFGRRALCDASRRGMILDVSHASEASAHEIFDISAAEGRPAIASHSNAYQVCRVSRNLRDWQIDRIVRDGGLIGLNFYGAFLCEEKTPSIKAVLSHVDYFLSRGAEDALALGGDMDGCDLPYDMRGLASLPYLAELMQRHGYGDALIRKIFFENANHFFGKYL